MTREEVLAYAQNRFGAEPEYLWEKFPTGFVLRHQNNRKWFAVSMDVRRDRLGLEGDGLVCVMDVKCGPLLSGSYLDKPGVIPAWHMNKSQWIGFLLDATAEDAGISRDLLDTLIAHKEGCVGMAANMIGVARRIIVFDNEGE